MQLAWLSPLVVMALQSAIPQGGCLKDDNECFKELFRDWQAMESAGKPTGDAGPKYSFNTTDGIFWVERYEIEHMPDGSVAFWLHGEHAGVRHVKYSNSIWHIWLDCKGRYWMDAFTTYGPKGEPIDTWDGYDRPSLIRPNTMYADLQRLECLNRRQ
jgi:hypothetical protein